MKKIRRWTSLRNKTRTKSTRACVEMHCGIGVHLGKMWRKCFSIRFPIDYGCWCAFEYVCSVLCICDLDVNELTTVFVRLSLIYSAVSTCDSNVWRERQQPCQMANTMPMALARACLVLTDHDWYARFPTPFLKTFTFPTVVVFTATGNTNILFLTLTPLTL